jgi:citrate lyase beta subunit
MPHVHEYRPCRAPRGPSARADLVAAARTFLFVGGGDRERLAKALASSAAAVIADLEDAVAPERKADARATLTAALAAAGPRPGGAQLVRVNVPDGPFGADDLDALAGLPLDGLVVPKATPARVAAAARLDLPLVPLVETAAGLREAYEIARMDGVVRLMLGTIDLALELVLAPLPDDAQLLHARSRIVLDSAAAGVARPIDGVVPDVRDEDALRAETLRARGFGFGAKACIHPRQLAVVAQALAPTAAEIVWARRVAEAYRDALADGRGSALVDGEMVDAPVARRARLILQETDADA